MVSRNNTDSPHWAHDLWLYLYENTIILMSMDTSHSVCLNLDWLVFLKNRIKF